MTNPTPAPAEALSRNKPATPFTPEEIEALTALAYHTAQAQRNTLLVGMACAADQLVAERATLLARAEAAEAERDRLLAGLEKLTAGWSELTGVGVCYAAEEVREVVRQAVGVEEASHE